MGPHAVHLSCCHFYFLHAACPVGSLVLVMYILFCHAMSCHTAHLSWCLVNTDTAHPVAMSDLFAEYVSVLSASSITLCLCTLALSGWCITCAGACIACQTGTLDTTKIVVVLCRALCLVACVNMHQPTSRLSLFSPWVVKLFSTFDQQRVQFISLTTCLALLT